MLLPPQIIRAKRRISGPQSVPAPIKGWNTRDPFEAMDPEQAILLDNWYPDFGGVNTRLGQINFSVTGGAGVVQTLAPFQTAVINKFLAACSGAIYDISNGGTVATPIKSGFTSDIWQTVTFNGHQFWVNGSDPAQIYDGTNLTNTGFTGADMSTMVGVGAFNNRLYFWDGVSASFWYGPVLGISGALSNFPLAMVTRAGGHLVAVEVLTYDGGTGIDDYTCFFMSSGEVLMYSGTDPSNANNWALVGRYTIAAPVGVRGLTRYGGDIYIITANDHQQLSKMFIALKLGEVPPRTLISGAATLAYNLGKNLPGWQALYYPGGGRIMYNIPNPNGTFSQHIYNTSTQAWCRFQGINAQCFGIYNGNLYAGVANGTVTQADTGGSDLGEPILSQAQQAWNLFETPLIKRVTAVRPVVQSNGLADFNFGLGFDYQPANIQVPDATVATGNSLIWGATNWGAPRVWGGSGVTDPRWHVGGGEGAAIGLALAANTQISATWIRTDLLIEAGRAL